jgi:hypothetical protein
LSVSYEALKFAKVDFAKVQMQKKPLLKGKKGTKNYIYPQPKKQQTRLTKGKRKKEQNLKMARRPKL